MEIKWDFKVIKPLCYILYGHSLKELDDNIEKFRDLDVIWTTMNNWSIAENILKKIDKKLDFVFLFGDNGVKSHHLKFLEESGDRGNTLFESLSQCVENNVKEIYLFGADGFNDKDTFGYNIGNATSQEMYPEDLRYFNEHYEEIKNRGTDILNTSQISKYDVPKITIDECIKKIKAYQSLVNTFS